MSYQSPYLSNNTDDPCIVEDSVEFAQVTRPPLYKVLLLNDDYTTMNFVVYILQNVFRHNETQAMQVMLQVHKKGSGTCGVYTKEIAETKVDQVLQLAQEYEHPLQCIMQSEEED